jgi:lipoprotein-anchoring transpeptidase ErfK/SrfK
MRLGRLPSTMLATAGLLVMLSACAPADPPAPAAPKPTPSATVEVPTPEAPASVGTSATAVTAAIAIHDAPDGAITSTLTHPQPSGAPLTFLVSEVQGEWLNVHLAQRPNGSTGWVRADEVMLQRLDYRLRVSTTENTVTLYRNADVEATYSAATGTGGTPTPTGEFYLTELLAPTNQGYGPFAFGVSAFSDAVTSFGGGVGQIGLHGTDNAASIGTAASHGCIRLSNEDITALAGILPLGTPVTIE